MNKTTEPAALAGIEPVAWLNKKLPYMAVLTKPDGGGWFPVYSAATIERLVQDNATIVDMYADTRDNLAAIMQERDDFNARYNAVLNNAQEHHRRMSELETRLAAMTAERDAFYKVMMVLLRHYDPMDSTKEDRAIVNELVDMGVIHERL